MARKSLTKKMLPNWPVPFLNFGQFWAAFQNFGHHLDRSTKTAPTPHLDRPDSDPLYPCPGPPPPPPPADLENKIWPKLVQTWFGQSWCWPNLVWPNFVKQLGQTSFGQSWFRQSWFRPLVGLLYKHPRRGGRDAVRSTVGRRFPLAPVPFQGILGTGIAVTAEMLLENRILSKTKLWVSFSGGDVLANGIQTRSQMGEFGHLSQKKTWVLRAELTRNRIQMWAI